MAKIANDIEITVISALWFFKEVVLDRGQIDSNTSVLEITELVNGGDNGINHRKSLFQQTLDKVNCL